MRTWKPPPGTKAVISIAAANSPTLPATVEEAARAGQERDRHAKALCERLGLKWKGVFNAIRLDHPRTALLLDAIEGTSGPRLVLQSCWLEEPPPRSSDPSAWFKLTVGAAEFRSPAKPPQGAHFGWRDGQRVASEKFLEAVRTAGLTGLASLPLEDSRPDDPMMWHEVFAEYPIGRGLDHPLLDAPRLFTTNQAKLRAREQWRFGISTVRLKDFRADTLIDDPVTDRLLRSGATKYFRVIGPDRFVREHLPSTDFAYMGWGIDRNKRPGHENRPVRTICCNARARKALIDAGVMKPSRFEPLATVPAAEADAEILDRTVPHPLPLPVYTPEEAAAERTRREQVIAAAAAKPTPPRLAFATIDDAIAYLQRRLDDSSATWTPSKDAEGCEDPRESEHFAKTPKAWQCIVDLLPIEVAAPAPEGGDEDFELRRIPPAWNDWLAYDPGALPPDEEPSTEDLIIAETPYGDWYAVRMGDPLLPADARVVHWDHETTTIKDEWPTIAAFVAEIIEACDRGGVAGADAGSS